MEAKLLEERQQHDQKLKEEREYHEAAQKTHENTQRELLDKISELIDATTSSDDRNLVSLPNDIKFNKVLDQLVRKTSVKKYNPRDQNVDAWLSIVMDEVRNIAMTKHLNMGDLTDK